MVGLLQLARRFFGVFFFVGETFPIWLIVMVIGKLIGKYTVPVCVFAVFFVGETFPIGCDWYFYYMNG